MPRLGSRDVPFDLLVQAKSWTRNPNTTIRADFFMALITNSTPSEVNWIQKRLTQLIYTLALPRVQAIAIVKAELKEKPWTTRPTPT
jgi:hypothetical protein